VTRRGLQRVRETDWLSDVLPRCHHSQTPCSDTGRLAPRGRLDGCPPHEAKMGMPPAFFFVWVALLRVVRALGFPPPKLAACAMCVGGATAHNIPHGRSSSSSSGGGGGRLACLCSSCNEGPCCATDGPVTCRFGGPMNLKFNFGGGRPVVQRTGRPPGRQWDNVPLQRTAMVSATGLPRAHRRGHGDDRFWTDGCCCFLFYTVRLPAALRGCNARQCACAARHAL
jgi:hypothetical protein